MNKERQGFKTTLFMSRSISEGRIWKGAHRRNKVRTLP